MIQLNEQVPDSTGAPGSFNAASNFQSGQMTAEYAAYFSIQAVISGTAVGVLSLQGSNDVGSPFTPFTGATNWTDITGSNANVTGSGSVFWNYQNCGFKWVRMVYTASSGTGTITARYNSKGS